MNKQSIEDCLGSETAVYDTIMVDICHIHLSKSIECMDFTPRKKAGRRGKTKEGRRKGRKKRRKERRKKGKKEGRKKNTL